MQEFRNMRTTTVSRDDAAIDRGLRSYMLGVYNLMAIGLVITALAAYVIASLATTTTPTGDDVLMLRNGLVLTDFGKAIYSGPLMFIIMFAPLIAVFILNFKINSLSYSAARLFFLVYAALVGLSLSSIFLVYTNASIIQTFVITAAAFGCLSLYGYTTKSDLRPLGAFLVIGMVGLFLAIVVNLFMHSSGLQFVISIAGVLIFAGLTAYDTQKIKELYLESDSTDTMGRKVVMGALSLYLDFINMFLFILQFINSNRN